jgi:CheY-like chemotaxis protein
MGWFAAIIRQGRMIHYPRLTADDRRLRWPGSCSRRSTFKFPDALVDDRVMEPSMLGHSLMSSTHPTLLIADDDPVVRSMLCLTLERQFEIVGAAHDSDEAIAMARTARPDVALIDVQMPGGGGLSAIRGIAEVSPDTAPVVLSADEFDPLVRQLMIAGAMTYVRKGIAPAQLAETLHRAIQARSLCAA